MNIIWRSDIERHGMCKNDPERECTIFCRSFITAKCNGMRILKVEEGFYRDQKRFPFGFKQVKKT